MTCCRGWTCCRGAAFQTCLVFRIWATYHVSSDANHTSMREPVNSSTGKTPVSTSFSRIAEHAEHGSCMPVSHEATGRARAHLRRPLIVPARAQAVCGTGPVAATLHGRPDAAESRSLRANACRVHATRSHATCTASAIDRTPRAVIVSWPARLVREWERSRKGARRPGQARSWDGDALAGAGSVRDHSRPELQRELKHASSVTECGCVYRIEATCSVYRGVPRPRESSGQTYASFRYSGSGWGGRTGPWATKVRYRYRPPPPPTPPCGGVPTSSCARHPKRQTAT